MEGATAAMPSASSSLHTDDIRDTLAAAREFMRRTSPVHGSPRITFPLPLATPQLAALRHSTNDRLMLDETWMNVDTSRWVPFGVPRPRASVS